MKKKYIKPIIEIDIDIEYTVLSGSACGCGFFCDCPNDCGCRNGGRECPSHRHDWPKKTSDNRFLEFGFE